MYKKTKIPYLGEKGVVEPLPVPQPPDEPGLVDSSGGEADGHGEVPDEGPPLHRDVLQGQEVEERERRVVGEAHHEAGDAEADEASAERGGDAGEKDLERIGFRA